MNDKDYLYDLLVHDLTGPLAVIETTARSLVRKEKQDGLTESQKNGLERILRNITKAKRLVSEILAVSRSEERLFARDSIYLKPLLKEVLANVLETMGYDTHENLCQYEDLSTLAKALEAKGINLKVTGRYNSSPFCHDRRKIELILENLISNAMKYRRKRMVVSISGDGDVVILISDDGMGIPEDQAKSLYKRFVQLKNAEFCRIEGLGLGLSCVKALVEAMEGEITCNSKEGWGTSFTVRIPPLNTDDTRHGGI